MPPYKASKATFRRRKVKDVAIFTEHIDFLNTWNGLNVQLL